MRPRQSGGRSSLLPLLAFALAAAAVLQAQTATETVIHTFANFPQGANPYGTLFRGADGTLYGTAYQGGTANLGVVFQLSAASYKVLYSFKGGTDGAGPYAGVVQDSAGNLYGTTYAGGAANAGVVYKVSPSGQETVLYSFTGGVDGGGPYAGVILDSAGNLYGTTYGGGLTACSGGCGVVYKVAPSSQETVLYSFTGGADGANPYAGVVSDPAGNLYGTNEGGGATYGVVYKVDTSAVATVLHTFDGGVAGTAPTAGVTRDATGNLYGTAGRSVYELDANGKYQLLAVFPAGINGGFGSPGALVLDAAGELFGTTDVTTEEGTPSGVVYKLDQPSR